MTICIDWGNSRVKVGLFNDTAFLEKEYNFSHEEAVKKIAEIITERNIEKGILCSVAHVPENLYSFFEEEKGFMVFKHDTPLPIMNAYATPETLGLDRLAGSIAAWESKPNSNHLIIQVGTALVYSFVSSNNIFRGGAIAPGIDLRIKSLHEHTDRLPLIQKEGMNTLIGFDTESSIRSGAINGVLHEIMGTIQVYEENYKDINITITGGDASLLVMKLKNKIFADPFLVLKGLYTIYKYNAS